MPLNRDGYRASDVPDGVAASDAVDCWNCASRPGGSAPLGLMSCSPRVLDDHGPPSPCDKAVIHWCAWLSG